MQCIVTGNRQPRTRVRDLVVDNGAGGRTRRRLLLFFCPADHPSRDMACATLAWVAEAEGKLFERRLRRSAHRSHYGGGPPANGDLNDLRGGTFTGGHHLEQLLLLLERFDCEAVDLGDSIFAGTLDAAGIPVRSKMTDLARLYCDVFETGALERPIELLIVGEGCCAGVSLTPFAAAEVINRKLLAVAESDSAAVKALCPGMRLRTLWTTGEQPGGAEELRPEQTVSCRGDRVDGRALGGEHPWLPPRRPRACRPLDPIGGPKSLDVDPWGPPVGGHLANVGTAPR